MKLTTENGMVISKEALSKSLCHDSAILFL